MNQIKGRCKTDGIRRSFRKVILSEELPPAVRDWRLSRFEHGLELADEIEARRGTLTGLRILEIGAAFGGEIAALHARGADCVGADLFDHGYAKLKRRIPSARRRLEFVRFDCMTEWPVAPASFDVIVSLGVLEFVQDRDLFFAEIARVLRPDGVAVINTPLSLPGLRRDAHYKLPAIALLPPRARTWVAEKLCRRSYRFTFSTHTYYSARTLKRCVAPHGLTALPVKHSASPIMARLGRWPMGKVWQKLIENVAFDYVFLHRCSGTQIQRPMPTPAACIGDGRLPKYVPTSTS